MNMDIHATHRIIQMLENSNQQIESVLDAMPGIFILFNERFQVLRANLHTARILEKDPEELLRMSLYQVFPEQYSDILQQYFSQCQSDPSGSPGHFELPVEDGSKKQYTYSWTLSQMTGASTGEGYIYILLGEDISRQQEYQNQLSSIFDSIPMGILLCDEEGRIMPGMSLYCTRIFNRNIEEKDILESLLASGMAISDSEDRAILEAVLCPQGARIEIYEESLYKLKPEYLFQKSEFHKRWFTLKVKPIVQGGRVKQILVLLEDISDSKLVQETREQIEIIERQNREIYEKAIRDPLTGLFNRLYMKDVINTMIHSRRRDNIEQLSLIMLDLDYFKRINDTYGHRYGDKVLTFLGELIIEEIRQTDIPIRYGGEEFLIFVPANADQAAVLAERIRCGMEREIFKYENETISITLSCGITSYIAPETLEDFIERADQLLYRAKRDGRNRIEIA